MLTGMIERNRNVAHVRRALEDLGAAVDRIEHAAKHAIVHFTTKEGVRWLTHVSNGPVEPHKLKGWARQSYNRAASRVEHEKRQNNRR